MNNDKEYKAAILRILDAAGQIVDNLDMPHLEQRLKDVAKYAPGVPARGLARIYETAARAWERGVNSGNDKGMDAGNQRCDKAREVADRILLLWDVKVDYPGLYPSFEWNGGHYYDTESLFKWISYEQGKEKRV